MEMIKRFLKDEEGATMVEYALMLGLIAVVCIIAVTAIGTEARRVFEYIEDELVKVAPGGAAS